MQARQPDRPRILIVEDEWILADALADALTDMGYDVAGPAASVPKALKLLEQGNIDAAILDISLGSGQKSFPVAAVLTTRGIPFLFITGYQAIDLLPDFVGKIVIAKPVLLDTLRRHLSAILSGLPTPDPGRRFPAGN
jgi:DNA-binding NtrC family response regulator